MLTWSKCRCTRGTAAASGVQQQWTPHPRCLLRHRRRRSGGWLASLAS